MTIIDGILISGAVQGIFLSLVLFFSQKGSKNGNRILSIFILLFAAGIILHVLAHGKYEEIFSYHSSIILIFSFTYTPLLYIYTKIVTGIKNDFIKKDLLHFVPFFLAAIITISMFSQIANRPVADKDSMFVQMKESFLHLSVYMQFLIYMSAILMKIKSHARRIENAYSSKEKVNLLWLKILLILLISTALIDGLLTRFYHQARSWDILWMFVSAYMYLIGYFALRQPKIFFLEEQEEAKEERKYKKSTLTGEQAVRIVGKINEAMEKNKIFLTENLTLPAFSAEISVSVHHLSQVINEYFKMNFFEFINRRRVEEARMMILDRSHTFTIADIALNSGFNSVSAFNNSFKRFTGQTPSQFKSSSE